MTQKLAKFAKPCQALFANVGVARLAALVVNQPMRQVRRTEKRPMTHLRAWRVALGLSRPEVVNRMLMLPGVSRSIDQATLAKWETGESGVKVEDLELLAKIYGVSADRLFFPPGDSLTPELLGEAYSIIRGKDPEAVRAWIASGKFLPESQKK